MGWPWCSNATIHPRLQQDPAPDFQTANQTASRAAASESAITRSPRWHHLSDILQRSRDWLRFIENTSPTSTTPRLRVAPSASSSALLVAASPAAPLTLPRQSRASTPGTTDSHRQNAENPAFKWQDYRGGVPWGRSLTPTSRTRRTAPPGRTRTGRRTGPLRSAGGADNRRRLGTPSSRCAVSGRRRKLSGGQRCCR